MRGFWLRISGVVFGALHATSVKRYCRVVNIHALTNRIVLARSSREERIAARAARLGHLLLVVRRCFIIGAVDR